MATLLSFTTGHARYSASASSPAIRMARSIARRSYRSPPRALGFARCLLIAVEHIAAGRGQHELDGQRMDEGGDDQVLKAAQLGR